MGTRDTSIFLLAFISIVCLFVHVDGCSHTKTVSLVDEPGQLDSMSEAEYLRNIEAYLPMLPDSIIDHYGHYNRNTFYSNYQQKITFVKQRIDSINVVVGPHWSIDTVSIDHSLENFGTAAITGRTLYLSSCYFFIFPNTEILQSIITHEFGHIVYSKLTPYDKNRVNNVWMALESSALLYIFHDGEYSQNARFGGHPEDTPSELFASAFNLFTNRKEELEARLRYVDEHHRVFINDLKELVEQSKRDNRPNSLPK